MRILDDELVMSEMQKNGVGGEGGGAEGGGHRFCFGRAPPR